MDIKRIAIGTIVGSIAFYFVSYVIFDFALASYYVANVGTATGALRTANIQWVFWIGNVAAALMIMLAFELKGGVISIANGFVIGAIIGLLVWLQADSYYYGATNIWNYKILIVDPLLSAVDAALGGAIMAAVLLRVPSQARAHAAR